MIFPDPGYLTKVRALCDKYNVIMCVDEIQVGFGRTGYLMAHHSDNVRPDMIVIGKGFSAGMVPASGVLLDDRLGKNI